MSRSTFGTLSTLIFIFVFFAAPPDAAAQEPARPPAPEPAPRAETEPQGQQRRPQQRDATRTEADEEFDLNITERRINEADYAASTAVEVGDVGASGLTLRVGVALRAAEIDVLLRNVRGHVRFRGSLETVLRRLGLRLRDAAPPLPAPQPSSPSP